MHLPEAHDVALVCDAPWEGNTSAYYTLFADGDLFRMYYRGSHFDEKTKKATHPEVTCYAESRDGIPLGRSRSWACSSSTARRRTTSSGPATGTHNFTPFKDANPDCPADARYKALAGGRDSGGKGLRAYQSPDGIHWSLMRDKPVITDGAFDSQNLAFWDGAAASTRVSGDFHRKRRERRARHHDRDLARISCIGPSRRFSNTATRPASTSTPTRSSPTSAPRTCSSAFPRAFSPSTSRSSRC